MSTTDKVSSSCVWPAINKSIPHILFLILLTLSILPGHDMAPQKWTYLLVIVLCELLLLVRRKLQSIHDIMAIIYAIFIFWQFFTVQIPDMNQILYPSPAKVFSILASDYKKILEGIVSSMYLLAFGFTLALVLGVALGILTGSTPRLRDSLLPIAKVVNPIPPIIYTPYAVAILPTFTIASIFVIFSSIFWQIYIQVAIGVAGIDHKLLDSAKTMNLSKKAMLLHIYWPYCLPQVMKTLPISVANSFMVLTAAEMIGATSGLGYFVRYYADFADYPRVLAGIIVIGVVVSALNCGISNLERRIIRWR